MEGYFIVTWDKSTFKRVGDIRDVADHELAKDIAKDRIEKGYGVSIWKGTRIFTSRE